MFVSNVICPKNLLNATICQCITLSTVHLVGRKCTLALCMEYTCIVDAMYGVYVHCWHYVSSARALLIQCMECSCTSDIVYKVHVYC